MTDPERNSEIRPGRLQGHSCQPHRFPRARSCLFWFPWPEAGLDQRDKRAGCAVASEAGPIASAPPPASWYSLLGPSFCSLGGEKGLSKQEARVPLDMGEMVLGALLTLPGMPPQVPHSPHDKQNH